MKLLSAIIASLVGIGRDCVKAHLSAAYTRLDASSRSEAVAIAINLGILQGRPLPITPCDFCPIGLYMAPNLCYNSIRFSKRKE